MKKNKQFSLWLALVVVSVFAVGGLVKAYSGVAQIVVEGDYIASAGDVLGGAIHNIIESFDEGIAVDGTTVIDGDGNWDGAVTASTGTFSSTLAVTGALDASIFTEGGGCTATSTVSATDTWTEAEMLVANCFEYSGVTAAAITITLPATSTMTSLIPNEGDVRSWLYQGYTAAATTTTFAAGTGIDLIGVTTNDDVIDGNEYAELKCMRMTDTDVTCLVSELVHAD